MMKSPHRSNRPDFSGDTMLEIVADHRNGTPPARSRQAIENGLAAFGPFLSMPYAVDEIAGRLSKASVLKLIHGFSPLI